jgi:hypothetical protein
MTPEQAHEELRHWPQFAETVGWQWAAGMHVYLPSGFTGIVVVVEYDALLLDIAGSLSYAGLHQVYPDFSHYGTWYWLLVRMRERLPLEIELVEYYRLPGNRGFTSSLGLRKSFSEARMVTFRNGLGELPMASVVDVFYRAKELIDTDLNLSARSGTKL